MDEPDPRGGKACGVGWTTFGPEAEEAIGGALSSRCGVGC